MIRSILYLLKDIKICICVKNINNKAYELDFLFIPSAVRFYLFIFFSFSNNDLILRIFH